MTTQLSAIDFTSDLKKLTKGFTGRKWVFDEIDCWLRESEERFFILTGEPGIGKSAIAAQLTQTRKDIAAYHFCIARQISTVEPNNVLLSLAAQLIKYFPDYGEALVNTVKPLFLQVKVEINIENIRDSVVQGVVIENLHIHYPKEALDIVLRRALAALPNPPKEPIAILIDSLDEAATYSNENNLVTLLSNVDDLPSWVRFILTSRPERRVLRGFDPLKPYHLQETSDESLSDIKQYVNDRVAQPALQNQLQVNQMQPQTLIDEITDLSHGNFLYTKLLLNDIEAGRQALDNLAALPKSIDDIYHGFLSRFSEKDWSDRYKPIFGVLAVAQEPISERQIANFTRIDPEDVRYSVRIARQFFNVDEDEQNETYSLFHQSLRDYLLDESRNLDFWCNERRQHQWIVGFYEETSKSWQDLEKVDQYGLFHLARHLVKADRKEELYNLLLTSPSWMQEKFVSCFGDASYLSDLEIALESLVDPLQPEQILTLVQVHTALRVIQQRSERYYSGSLSAALIWLGREAEVLNYANLSPDSGGRYAILANTYKTLRQRGYTDRLLLDKVWEAAQAIEGISHCIGALGDVALELDRIDEVTKADEAFSQAINLAEQNRPTNNGQNKTQTLIGLAKYLVKSSSVKRQEQAVKIYSLAYETAQQMQDFQKQSLLSSNVELAKLHDLQWQAILLCELSSSLGQMKFQERAATVLAEAQEIAKRTRLAVQNLKQRALALEYAKDYLKTTTSDFSEENQKILRDHIELNAINNFLISNGQNYVEYSLAQALLALQHVDKAKQLLGNFDIEADLNFFSSAVQDVASALINQKQFLEAQELAERIPKPPEKIKILGYIASTLAQRKKEDREEGIITFEEIWNILEQDIKDRQQKDLALFYIVQSLVDAQYFNEAEETAHKIQDRQYREEAILSLVRSLIQFKPLAEAEQVTYIRELICTIQETKKADALAELCVSFAKTGLKAEADNILVEIRRLPQGTPDFTRAVGSLCGLAKILAQSEYLQQAETLFEHIEVSINNRTSSNNQEWAIYVLAINLAQSRISLAKAESLIAQISEPSWREQALQELAVAQSAKKRFTEAERIINSIKNSIIQSQAWSQLAIALYEAGDIAEVNRILDLLIASAQTPRDLKILAQTFSKVERYAAAEEVADGIQEVSPKEELLTDLAISLARNGYFSRAEQILEKVETSWLRMKILKVLAVGLLEDHLQSKLFFDKAIQETEVIKEDWRRCKLLGELAITLFKCGHYQDARNLIDKVKTTAKETINFWLNSDGQTRNSNQAEVYRWLSETLAQTGYFAEALSVIRSPEASIIYSSQELDSFLEFLVSWASSFEDINPEFPIRILKESIRIAGWIRFDWNDVYTSVLI